MIEELKLQLALLGIKYNYDQINLHRINWNKFFIDSSNNRILFYCCKKLIELNLTIPTLIKKTITQEILPHGQTYIDKTKKTIEYLNENLKDFPFLVCKTEKLIEYITFDVDCLFLETDYKQALDYLNKLGGAYVECKKKLQGDIIMEGMLRMDMHDNFHWQGSDFISTELLWAKTERKPVFMVECHVPNLENEVILNLLNLIYERHYVPALDYYYILQQKEQINWEVIFEVAKKFNWEKSLLMVLNKFNQIHFFLFNELLIDLHKYQKDYTFEERKKLSIPFIFTYREGINVFRERLARCHYFKFYEFFYFLFAKTRFHLIKGKKVPIYGHWHLFKNLNE